MMLPLITLAAFASALAPTVTPATLAKPMLAAPVLSTPVLATRAAGPAVTAVSVVPASGRADVVVDLQSPVEVSDFTLDAPYRVVIDLKGAELSGPTPAYDRAPRGGVTDIRVSQFRQNVVRLVIQLDEVHPYAITRGAKEIRVSFGGPPGDFAAWHGRSAGDVAESGSDSMDRGGERVERAPASRATLVSQPSYVTSMQQSTQPRITVTYQDADIRDVIAAFATFSGRTIVVGKDVSGTVTAEIRNQPWDVALRAILQGQGLAATEDPVTGIITVDSYANVQARQALEPLVTQLIPINYAKADSLVPVVTKLLAKDCIVAPSSAAGGQVAVPQGGGQGMPSFGATCVTRGAVAANPGTNTLIVTETPSRIGSIINYVQNLDVRTPQVAIKAKIIFVDRTNIENLGLSYDLGSRDQYFGKLVRRPDPKTGDFTSADVVHLGGNTLSALANANNRVTSPALQLVYSAAIGKFSLTTFLDALQEVRLADLQAEPSIVTVDNRQAQIQVGQDIPVRVLDASTAGLSGGTAIPKATVSFKPVGIILNVTPHITNNRQILLDVHAENSDAQIAGSDVGYVFNKQSADNRLLVGDGETAVIGGLTVTQVSQNKSGIPVLVDLPLVGKLFGTTNKSEEKRDLLILITPHVIDEGERVRPTRD